MLALFSLLAFFALGAGISLLALFALFALFAFFAPGAGVSLLALGALSTLQALEPFRFAAFKAVLHCNLIGRFSVLRFSACSQRHAQRRAQTDRCDHFPKLLHLRYASYVDTIIIPHLSSLSIVLKIFL